MKKNVIKVCSIICTLVICYLIFLKPAYTYADSCNIDYTYTDASRKYVREMSYSYNSIKKEEIEVEILLEKESVIKVENYISEEDCIIKIFNNDDTLLESITLKENEIIKNIVQEKGEYKMIISFKPGIGEGNIKIE